MPHTTIKQRLMFLITIPLLALLISAGQLIVESYRNFGNAQKTQATLRIAVAAGDLIHTLQIERGSTAGFIESKGAKLADALPGIRAKSDENLSRFQQTVASVSTEAMPELQQALAKVASQLDGLPAIRDKANRFAIGVPEEVGFYTATISSLIEAIATTGRFNSVAAITQQTFAYLGFVRAKENAGQERALTTAAFSAASLDAPRFHQILARVYRQEAYLDVFASAAGADEKAALAQLMETPAVAEVLRMRKVLAERYASGGYGIEPADWFKTISQKIDGMREIEKRLADKIDQTAAGIVQASRRALIGYLAMTLVCALLVIGLSLWVARSVSQPLAIEVEVAEQAIKDDDFTHQVPESGPEEVVRSGHAFNELMGKFRHVISDTKLSSGQITDAAHTLAASSDQVNQSSVAQSDAAATVAAAVQQASVSVSETSANAQTATIVVARACQETAQAMEVMAQMVGNMKHIAHLIGESQQSVTLLSESSGQIGGIVQVIREIADQTNLLALNAAIEAARAGEQGRGFAVVADEVRKLAERTTKATGEISALIKSIQSGVNGTVKSMHQADIQAVSSLELVGSTEQALSRIDESSKEIAATVGAMSDALREQDAAIQQVAISVEKIAQMAELNCHAAESNNSTAHGLDNISTHLRENVGHYRV
jgi:methyl-accepting chemotaxis protein